MVNALVGNEVLYVQGTDAAGHPAATTFPVTVQQIAQLTGSGVYAGTFVATGATAVTVLNANILNTRPIDISLNTVGGTPSNPVITTITTGVGFTVTAGLGDTSTYNYAII